MLVTPFMHTYDVDIFLHHTACLVCVCVCIVYTHCKCLALAHVKSKRYKNLFIWMQTIFFKWYYVQVKQTSIVLGQIWVIVIPIFWNSLYNWRNPICFASISLSLFSQMPLKFISFFNYLPYKIHSAYMIMNAHATTASYFSNIIFIALLNWRENKKAKT